MSDIQLSGYVSRTRAYLRTPEARRADRYQRDTLGWPYERRLAAAVMTATRLIVYERISAVVDEIMLSELKVPA